MTHTTFYDCLALFIASLATVIMLIVIFGIPILAIGITVFVIVWAVILALKTTGVIALLALIV